MDRPRSCQHLCRSPGEPRCRRCGPGRKATAAAWRELRTGQGDRGIFCVQRGCQPVRGSWACTICDLCCSQKFPRRRGLASLIRRVRERVKPNYAVSRGNRGDVEHIQPFSFVCSRHKRQRVHCAVIGDLRNRAAPLPPLRIVVCADRRAGASSSAHPSDRWACRGSRAGSRVGWVEAATS